MDNTLNNLAKTEKYMTKASQKKITKLKEFNILKDSALSSKVLVFLCKNDFYYFNMNDVINKYSNHHSKYSSIKEVKDKYGMTLHKIEYLAKYHLVVIPNKYYGNHKYLKIKPTKVFKNLVHSYLKYYKNKHKRANHELVIKKKHDIKEKFSNQSVKQNLYNLSGSKARAFIYWKKSYGIDSFHMKHFHVKEARKRKDITKGIQLLKKFNPRNVICLKDFSTVLFQRSMFFRHPLSGTIFDGDGPKYKFLNFNWLYRLVKCHLINVSLPEKYNDSSCTYVWLTPDGKQMLKDWDNSRFTNKHLSLHEYDRKFKYRHSIDLYF